MLPSAAHAGRAVAAEASSPELVLVDRAHAARARERLPVPDDTLARIEHELAQRRLAARRRLLEGAAPGSGASSRVPAWRAGHLRRRVRRRAAAATGLAAALTTAVLLGVQVDLRGTPAGAESLDARRGAAPSSSATRDEQDLPAATAEASPRRFAWASVPGASSYRVEFFQGGRLVYSVRTKHSSLELPASWHIRGRTQRLDPGRYRWYVWPVRDGRADERATVQAELVVK